MECENCEKSFSSKSNLKRHMKNIHQMDVKKQCISTTIDDNIGAGPSRRNCIECGVNIPTVNWNFHLRSNSHKQKVLMEKNKHFQIINQAYENRIETLVYRNKDESNLIAEKFLKEPVNNLVDLFGAYLDVHQAVKYNIELFALYVQINKEDEDKSLMEIKEFQTKMKPIFNKEELVESYNIKIYEVLKKMEEFQERGSDWILVSLLHLEININKYQPIKGSTYIPLPKTLANKKACVNVHNDDVYCFKWAIISALSPLQSNLHRSSAYNVHNIEGQEITINEWILNFKGLSFPLKIEDTRKFEQLNPRISVNIFGYDEKLNLIVGPYYKTKVIMENHINLLYIQDDSTEKAHYIWIKNISR